jgi:hypothetical protein
VNERKQERIAQAQKEANDRRMKAIHSLAHCLGRSDVMRLHHDSLVHEMLGAERKMPFTTAKKTRFSAYVCFWFASLATVVERYQQLVGNGTLPESPELSQLLTPDFIDLLKPFRNAIAHCSDHDDARVLQLLSDPHRTPDHAAAVARAFKMYFKQQDPALYEGEHET